MAEEEVKSISDAAGIQDTKEQGSEAGGQGSGNQEPKKEIDSWRAGLPEDIRENPHLTRYGSQEEAARGIIEAQNFISTTRPTVPKEDAPAEEWDKFFNSLGRPEKPEGYEITKPEKLPEGFPYSEELDKQWQTWAHKAGLTTKQFKTIRDEYLTANVADFNQVLADQGQREEQVTAALEKIWGGKYKEELALSSKTAQSLIETDEDWNSLAFALDNDERLVLLFNRIGHHFSEDTLRGLGTGGAHTSFKKQAQAKQAELLNIDKRKEAQRYKETRAEAEELFKKAEAAGELT